MMRLYHTPASPYARKVRLVLHETGLAGKVALVRADGSPADSGTMPLAIAPLGKLPVLERDDGPALYDSRVICRYLDDLSGGRLSPEPPRLWGMLTLEALAEGIMDAALAMVYERRLRPEPAQIDDLVEGQWTKIARALTAIEARWMAHLAGPRDLAQLGLAAALGYLDLRLDDRAWRQGHDALAAWFGRLETSEAMTSTAA